MDGTPGQPPSSTRRLDDIRRVVIKIGSRILVDENQMLDEDRVASIAGQLAKVRSQGREVICVSSGAIAAGLRAVGCAARPRDLPTLQAAAAAGQARLIGLYRRLLAEHDLEVAQVLLTHADLRSRERHLNARNTFNRLFSAGMVAIVNENDTVAVDEIRVGDNDLLSALVACLVRADILILLTTADGLMTIPPNSGPGELVPRVERVTPEILAMAGDAGSDLATGGMRSKLEAVEMVTRAGERAVIANGHEPDVVCRIVAGEPLGTMFEPSPRKLAGRKRWIAFFDHPRGELEVDSGAARAVRDNGKSLLPVGVQAVRGTFGKGASVRIVDAEGIEIARALVNYSSNQLRRIIGRRSDKIVEILGTCEYEEAVHRDNLVLR